MAPYTREQQLMDQLSEARAHLEQLRADRNALLDANPEIAQGLQEAINDFDYELAMDHYEAVIGPIDEEIAMASHAVHVARMALDPIDNVQA